MGRGCCVTMLHLRNPMEIDVSLPQFTLWKFIFTPALTSLQLVESVPAPSWARLSMGSPNPFILPEGKLRLEASPGTLILLGSAWALLTQWLSVAENRKPCCPARWQCELVISSFNWSSVVMTLSWYPFLSLLERRTPKETLLLQPHSRPWGCLETSETGVPEHSQSPYLVT